MQQADRDRLDAGLLQRPHALAHLVVVELDQHVAVRDGDPLLHRQPVAALDERPRLPRQLLLEREVERLLVPGDVDDVAEAVRRDHPGLRAGMGEHDVGRDGRPVQEVVDVRERDAGLRAQRLDALDDAARRVVRGRRDLVDGDPALLLVDQDQVGERAADVDADALHAPTSCERRNDRLPDQLHLLEPPVQVRGRDLVDPQLAQLSDLLQAPLHRPGDDEVVDELAGQIARVLGRRVEVAGVVVVLVARGDEAGHLLRHAVLAGSTSARRRCGSRTPPAPSGTPPTPPPGRPRRASRRARRSRPRRGRGPPPRRRRGRGRSPSARTRGGRRRRSSRCPRARPPGAGSSARSRRA